MPSIEHPVRTAAHHHDATPIETDATLFVTLELSLTRWIIVASAPGEDKASKHAVAACDGPGLLALLDRLRERAEHRRGGAVAIVVMQEAGRDGFWVHRLLETHGMKSHVVDPSSIAVNRRSRRAKTDRIDAEAMLRTLMAWSRGERQVCSMVRPPTREAEDARRLSREREALLAERIRHANRIKGLLATQGIFGFEPTRHDRRGRLAGLRTAQGQTLPPRLGAELLRQVDRLELTMQQLAARGGGARRRTCGRRLRWPGRRCRGGELPGDGDTESCSAAQERGRRCAPAAAERDRSRDRCGARGRGLLPRLPQPP